MSTTAFYQAADLVGCRFRRTQAQRYPNTPASEQSQLRKQRLIQAREEILALLPTHPQQGDPKHFLRIDLQGDPDTRHFATLEAMAAGAHLITRAVLEGQLVGLPEQPVRVELDALVRKQNGYMPVLISNHRITRPDARRELRAIPTNRLGLSNGYKVTAKLKHHAIDSFSLAMAAQLLEALGQNSHRGALIGQYRELAYVLNTDLLQPGLERAIAQDVPQQPHRIKECASCRYWEHCEQALIAQDSISLVHPGDRGRQLKAAGFDTVQQLIDYCANTPAPELSTGLQHAGILAQAWRAKIPLLKQVPTVQHPRFDVEIDIDVESYLDQGAYLWGTYDGTTYRPFAIWEGLGQAAEGANFARFWRWLEQRRLQAASEGKSLGVFCYSAHGENHWLTFCARRFHGKVPGVPHPEEVAEFIASEQWIDVFAAVRKQLIGPEGIGLKIVAPQAGFHWREADVDGEGSVNLFMQIANSAPDSPERQQAIDMLLSYNEDDCRATAAVREWLAYGAPGVPSTSTLNTMPC